MVQLLSLFNSPGAYHTRPFMQAAQQIQQRRNSHSIHWSFIVVLACYLIASVFLAFRLAPLSGPDEASHYAYITYIRDTGNAPPPFRRDESKSRTKRLEPPAYYTLIAIISSAFDDGRRPEFEPNPFYASTVRGNQNPVLRASPMLLAARLATVAFGLVGLMGLYVGVAQWLEPQLAAFVAALLAFQPNYLYFSATLNNDIGVVAVGLWVFAAIVGIVLRGGSQLKHFGLGALWGTALLMQGNAGVLGLGLLVVWLGEYRRNGAKPALHCMAHSLAGCVVFYGPWWLNRIIISGSFDVPTQESFLLSPATLLNMVWPNWHLSNLRQLRPTFYLGLVLILVTLAATWLLQQTRVNKLGFFYAFRGAKPSLFMRPMLLLIIVFAVVSLSRSLLHLQEVQPQARIVTLTQLPSTATQPNLRFGADQSLELAATESLSTQSQRADVQLYWRVLKPPQHNYAVRVELVIPNATTTQLDAQTTFPGYGTSPTQGWHEGDLIVDTLSFYPTSSVALHGPTRALVVIKLLQLPQPPTHTVTATLPVWRDGASVDFPSAQEIVVRPAHPISLPTQFALPAPAQFGDGIRLAAHAATWADGKLRLTLWWQATADVQSDLTPFVHVLSADGALLAQSDGVPNAGLSPTQFWRTGDVVRDEREIDMAQQSGLTLALGFYDSATKERLTASQSNQLLQDNLLRLPL